MKKTILISTNISLVTPNIQHIISIIRFILVLILFLDTIVSLYITPCIIELLTDVECSLQNIYDTYSFTIQTDDQQTMPRQTCCYGRIFVVLPLDNNDLSHAKDLRILRIHILLFLQLARAYPCARYEKRLSDSF